MRTWVLAATALSGWSQVTVAIQPLSVQVTAAEAVALQPLTGRLQDRLAQQVVKLPNVSLFDRQHVDELLRERHFADPASMDRAAADSIGRMLRVDVMLVVSFYPLENTGLFSKWAGEKRWTASADTVEVATGHVVAKSVCGGIASEAEILACAQQIARDFQPSAASLWNVKQQQAKAQAEAQQQQVKAQAEAAGAAAASLQKDEEQRRVAAQQRGQAMRVEELRHAETLQRERTDEARLSLQRMQEEKAQQEARARLDSELERVKTRLSDLAAEADATLDFWTRFEREVQRQRGGSLRSEIRSANTRLRSDMDGANDCLKRSQLTEALAYMEKARKEIEVLEQMK